MNCLMKSGEQDLISVLNDREKSKDDFIVHSCVSAIWILSGDEPDSIATFQRYTEALEKLPIDCELIVVVNGNIGAAVKTLQPLTDLTLPTTIAQIHRRCDEATAVRVGLEASRGEYVVLLPPYVQIDPSAIVDMIAEVRRGAHYVTTWRNPRVDSRWGSFKSRIFNRITSYMTGVRLHDINSGLRLMTREVADHLPIYGDLLRFSPILAALQGFVVAEVSVRHVKERRVETGDYRIGVYLRRALDLLTLFFLFKFTKKPLRFFGVFGTTCLAIGIAVIAFTSFERFMGVSLADRPALLLGVVLVVLGVQLFSVGLLGELIIFTHGRGLFYQHVEELRTPAEMTPDRED